jgi:tetratricopeptide (TPR) repeat protein
MVEVLETSPDSVTVEYVRGETKVKVKVPARALDPHSFYSIRRGRMEDTAENHLALARFCYESNLLALARKHLDLAIATDPEFVEQRKAQVPDLVEKFSTSLLADAKKYADQGDFDNAEMALAILFEAFPETESAVAGHELLAAFADLRAKREVEAKEAKIAKLEDETAKKAARERAALLRPLEEGRDLGRKMIREGLTTKSQSTAKSLFDQAIPQLKQTIGAIDAAMRVHSGKPELLAELDELRASTVVESIHAHCLAGGICLSRGAYTEADEYARRALAVDPESAEAQGFLVRVQNAIAMKDDIDVRRLRPRGGGGR